MRILYLLAPALVALALAACGAGEDPAPASNGTSNRPALDEKTKQAMLNFARCMRQHGVDMPDPKFDEHGGMTQLMPEKAAVDKEKFQEAEKACQPILDAARPERSAGEGEGS